jgi:hypothetical protein
MSYLMMMKTMLYSPARCSQPRQTGSTMAVRMMASKSPAVLPLTVVVMASHPSMTGTLAAHHMADIHMAGMAIAAVAAAEARTGMHPLALALAAEAETGAATGVLEDPSAQARTARAAAGIA